MYTVYTFQSYSHVSWFYPHTSCTPKSILKPNKWCPQNDFPDVYIYIYIYIYIYTFTYIYIYIRATPGLCPGVH